MWVSTFYCDILKTYSYKTQKILNNCSPKTKQAQAPIGKLPTDSAVEHMLYILERLHLKRMDSLILKHFD